MGRISSLNDIIKGANQREKSPGYYNIEQINSNLEQELHTI